MKLRRLRLLRDVRQARREGVPGITRRQHARLAALVAYARAHAPYYRDLYQNLPDRVTDPTVLPVTDKVQLMAHFDTWVTDRAVTLDQVRTFVDTPTRIGVPFQGRYTVATTSGTTGTRGIFLLDSRTMRVTNALALRMLTSWLSGWDVLRILGGRGRMTMVMAAGGHFASAIAAARLRRTRLGRAFVQTLPVSTPLPELVTRLNRFRPVVLAPYASMGALLASEQQAGRLHINPVLVVLSAEGLPQREYARIEAAFGATVRHSYAATECPFLSYSCPAGWLHVNSDWVILEPVDAAYQPVPPGEQSHTVLITNLANRIQPILRYDLGDRVLMRPDPCPCGNPLPAIQVQGRSADVLTLLDAAGTPVTLPPLLFGTLLDHIPGVDLVQIVQTAPTTLRVRLQAMPGTDPDELWQTVARETTALLTQRGLAHVTLARATEPPEQTTGGKYRRVIPLRPGTTGAEPAPVGAATNPGRSAQ